MIDTITITTRSKLRDIEIDCSIEEQSEDTLTITDHPVERGAPVSDHAYLNPAQLVMRIGYSNSSRLAGGDETYVTRKYEELLALQAEREPFSVVTSRRAYSSMMIRSIAVTTNATTSAVLLATVTLREVILVDTEVTAVPQADTHDDPKITAPPVNTGSKQLKPVGG